MMLKRPFLRKVASLRFLDIYWRFLFPMAYVPYLVVTSLGEEALAGAWESRIFGATAFQGCK